jgi:hypothetical protein
MKTFAHDVDDIIRDIGDGVTEPLR